MESLRSLRPRAIVTAGVALLALTGCTGEAESPAPSPAITVTRTATPSPSATEPAEAAPFATPGSTLAGQDDLVLPALAQDAAGTQTEVAIAYTLGDVVTGEIDDLEGVLTDAEIDELWYQYPVFVHYTATVSGPPVPAGFTITEPVSVTGTTTTGGEASAPEGEGAPSTCAPVDVAALSADGTAEGCWTLLVRYDAELTGVRYSGTFQGTAADYMTAPVTWEVQ
ncbi:MAG: hypothetical protein ACK5IM_11355 [Demequina sp.]|uniref:hypothetical protein n=1 Tax=Demequina sp. TaxID=2050685 RepID=UPI003A85632C